MVEKAYRIFGYERGCDWSQYHRYIPCEDCLYLSLSDALDYATRFCMDFPFEIRCISWDNPERYWLAVRSAYV